MISTINQIFVQIFKLTVSDRGYITILYNNIFFFYFVFIPGMLVSDSVLAVDARSIEKSINLLFISEFSDPDRVQNNFRSMEAIKLNILLLKRAIFTMSF